MNLFSGDNHTFINPNFMYIIQHCLQSSIVVALIIYIYIWRFNFPGGHSLYIYLIFYCL